MPDGDTINLNTAADQPDTVCSSATDPSGAAATDRLLRRLIAPASWWGGAFVVTAITADGPVRNHHIPNSEDEDVTLAGLRKAIAAAQGANCYIGISLTREGLTPFQRGAEEDLIGVLAAVTDFDLIHKEHD